MKNIILLLCLILFTTHIAVAQSPLVKKLTPKLRAEKAIGALQGELMLTDKQKTGLYDILFSQYTKMDSLRNVKADITAMKAQSNTTREQLTALLNADQLAKLKAWQNKGLKKRS